jgi:hypothetical protein
MPPKALITEAIKQEGETRYILLLTKNNAALSIIQEQVLGSVTRFLGQLWLLSTVGKLGCTKKLGLSAAGRILNNMTNSKLC